MWILEGYCIAVDSFCGLPLFPLLNLPPLWLYVLVWNVLGTRHGVPLLFRLWYPVGVSALGGTEIFLLRVNAGVHRGVYRGLGLPTCCLSHPIAMP